MASNQDLRNCLSVMQTNQVPGESELFIGSIFLYLPVICYLQNITDELKIQYILTGRDQGSHMLKKEHKEGWILLFCMPLFVPVQLQ